MIGPPPSGRRRVSELLLEVFMDWRNAAGYLDRIEPGHACPYHPTRLHEGAKLRSLLALWDISVFRFPWCTQRWRRSWWVRYEVQYWQKGPWRPWRLCFACLCWDLSCGIFLSTLDMAPLSLVFDNFQEQQPQVGPTSSEDFIFGGAPQVPSCDIQDENIRSNFH
jgi:hypothetical protein